MILGNLYFYLKVLYLLVSGNFIPAYLVRNDYDALSFSYDDYFSSFIKPHSADLVKRLKIEKNTEALDLACGTGVITSEIEKYIRPYGKITAVDFSAGMIGSAKRKQKGDVEFLCLDMKEALKTFRENSFDYVTCGWAMGYSRPIELLKRIRRVLKRNGKVGIIENRKDTLEVLRNTGMKVMRKYPGYIRYLMNLTWRLPGDKRQLESFYKKSGLFPVEIWDGEVEVNFKDGKEVLNWVSHTGASAGFDKIMAPEIKDKCDEAFIEIIEKDYSHQGKITVSHKYVAGIAEKR